MCDHLSKSPKFSQWNQYRWNLSVVSDKGATTFLDDGLSCPLFYPPVIKGPFKAWFELAVRTTLLRVRLLIRQNAMYFYWQYESALIVTWKLHAEPLLQNEVAGPGKLPPLSQRYNKMPILGDLDITKGQGTTKIIHHTVSTVNINSHMKNCTKVRVQIPNTKNSI